MISAKIAISGSFSVGKTTLCCSLVECVGKHGFHAEILPESAREIVARGYHVDLEMSPIDVFAYIATQLAAERAAPTKGYVFADRWLLDLYAFLSSDTKLPHLLDREAICASVEEVVWTQLHFYDRYVYISPTLPIIEDGIRDSDPVRQCAFAEALLRAYEHFRITPIVFDPLKEDVSVLARDFVAMNN
jgi:predicted ATPase